jgi:23S rRNA pseudouridine1911/1915/1917 synthase
VVLFARRADAARSLAAAWDAGALRRVYRAIVDGRPPDGLELTRPIGQVAHGGRRVAAACDDGRPARSVVRVLEPRGAGTLVDVEIFTGRPHQVRIHLAAAGHALAGDGLWGAGGLPRADSTANPADPGGLLHALRLEVAHPATGAPLVLAAPPPPPLQTELEAEAQRL